MAELDAAADARARLEAWQAGDADRIDPVRFRLMQALAGRAAAQGGAARSVLEARLQELVAAYAAIVRGNADKVGATMGPSGPAPTPAVSALGALVHDLAARARPAIAAAPNEARPLSPAPAQAAHAPLVDTLADYFRETWARVSVEQQFRQSLERVPENAGPLNTDHLVHRALSLMRETSPEYLRHFLSYVEGMAWLEQLGAAAAAQKEAARAAARKSTRGKARK
ncbi:DUF2894 domain-containing protein [Cupriavidus taiwanensis]|uniref:DUF2894 domain-containing protein n=1 Tax=Cupriavidus taiwanensis TaxID=164546 RepID=UPI000E104B24|nr:DUF2894 domain-containing protein [Cupriavidus taiwanensis]SOY70453.1 conserved hypothetical protein [Cupriavidus taiwanensis]SOY72126.1 conserved hypothetical protein [Cupriavidus taiwanensis]SOY95691.1 conserved hypothetical protein [Cupriavidus taiwanensis]SOZ74846.1 conserved hypothetical protein [Cupriavidus taiwanensis]SOZ88437.1 conserved hypothetical protein [Cupriavidus taiwanensis]